MDESHRYRILTYRQGLCDAISLPIPLSITGVLISHEGIGSLANPEEKPSFCPKKMAYIGGDITPQFSGVANSGAVEAPIGNSLDQ